TPIRAIDASASTPAGLKPKVCGDADGEGGPFKPLQYKQRRPGQTIDEPEDTPGTVARIKAHNKRHGRYCAVR
ncbi:MAG: hypothetical protein ACRDHG_03225, partial [Anaerolineales bacterium]